MKTPHHESFVRVVERVAPFIWRHHPRWEGMSFELLCDYLAWFWNRGLMAIAFDRLGEIDAVCLVRLFRHLHQFMDEAMHDPCGEFCRIELMVSDSVRGMARIFDLLSKRWGPQKYLLWDRGERTMKGAPRLYSWADFEKLARRLTKQRT